LVSPLEFQLQAQFLCGQSARRQDEHKSDRGMRASRKASGSSSTIGYSQFHGFFENERRLDPEPEFAKSHPRASRWQVNPLPAQALAESNLR